MASIVEQDPDSKTIHSRGGDAPDITHLVHICQLDATPRLARCGYDCSDRQERTTPVVEMCVVCQELSAADADCERCR